MKIDWDRILRETTGESIEGIDDALLRLMRERPEIYTPLSLAYEVASLSEDQQEIFANLFREFVKLGYLSSEDVTERGD